MIRLGRRWRECEIETGLRFDPFGRGNRLSLFTMRIRSGVQVSAFRSAASSCLKLKLLPPPAEDHQGGQAEGEEHPCGGLGDDGHNAIQ